MKIVISEKDLKKIIKEEILKNHYNINEESFLKKIKDKFFKNVNIDDVNIDDVDSLEALIDYVKGDVSYYDNLYDLEALICYGIIKIKPNKLNFNDAEVILHDDRKVPLTYFTDYLTFKKLDDKTLKKLHSIKLNIRDSHGFWSGYIIYKIFRNTPKIFNNPQNTKKALELILNSKTKNKYCSDTTSPYHKDYDNKNNMTSNDNNNDEEEYLKPINFDTSNDNNNDEEEYLKPINFDTSNDNNSDDDLKTSNDNIKNTINKSEKEFKNINDLINKNSVFKRLYDRNIFNINNKNLGESYFKLKSPTRMYNNIDILLKIKLKGAIKINSTNIIQSMIKIKPLEIKTSDGVIRTVNEISLNYFMNIVEKIDNNLNKDDLKFLKSIEINKNEIKNGYDLFKLITKEYNLTKNDFKNYGGKKSSTLSKISLNYIVNANYKTPIIYNLFNSAKLDLNKNEIGLDNDGEVTIYDIFKYIRENSKIHSVIKKSLKQ